MPNDFYDPGYGLPDLGPDPWRNFGQQRRPGLIAQPPKPRPLTPLAPEPTSTYARALAGPLRTIGRVAGMFGRGVSTSVEMLRAGLTTGDPLSGMTLPNDLMQGDALTDIGAAVGVVEPTVHPDAASLAKAGYLQIADVIGAENITGERIDTREPLGIAQQDIDERRAWERANPGRAYTKAVLGPVSDLALGFALDPTTAALVAKGSLGAARAVPATIEGTSIAVPMTIAEQGTALGKLGRAFLPIAERVGGPLLVPTMAAGAAENLSGAYDLYQEEGFTPEVLRQGTAGTLEAALAALGAKHAYDTYGPKGRPPAAAGGGRLLGDGTFPTARVPPARGARPGPGAPPPAGARPGVPRAEPIYDIADAEIVPRTGIDQPLGLPEMAGLDQADVPAARALEDAIALATGAEPGAPRLGPRNPVRLSPAARAAAEPENFYGGRNQGLDLPEEARPGLSPEIEAAVEARLAENNARLRRDAADQRARQEEAPVQGITYEPSGLPGDASREGPFYRAEVQRPKPTIPTQEEVDAKEATEAAAAAQRAGSGDLEAAFDVPTSIFLKKNRYVVDGSQESAATAAEAFRGTPAERKLHDALGGADQEITVYRTGDVEPGTYQSYTLDPKATGHLYGTEPPKPYLVRVRDIAFPGAFDQREVVIRSVGEAITPGEQKPDPFTFPLRDVPEAARPAAEATGSALSRRFAETGRMDDAALDEAIRLAPELEPHRDKIRRHAVLEASARIQGNDFMTELRSQYERSGRVATKMNGVEVVPVGEGAYDVVQRVDGKVVGGAMVRDGHLSMIAGGKAMGSPVSIRPVYEAVDSVGAKRNNSLTLLGARARETFASRQPAAPAGSAAAVPVPARGKGRRSKAGPGAPAGPAGAIEAPPETREEVAPTQGEPRPGTQPEKEVVTAPAGELEPPPVAASPDPVLAAKLADGLREQIRAIKGQIERAKKSRASATDGREINRLDGSIGALGSKLADVEARLEPLAAVAAVRTTAAAPARAETPEQVAAVAADITPDPTPAQVESGNYSKGHLKWKGLDITLETAKGGTRTAKDGSWSVPNFPAHYGYVKRTEGADGEHVDVFLGEHGLSEEVHIIDQADPETKKFDEHKAMLGFRSRNDAIDAYQEAFTDFSGPDRVGAITTVPLAQFKAWLANGNTRKPFSPELTFPFVKRDAIDIERDRELDHDVDWRGGHVTRLVGEGWGVKTKDGKTTSEEVYEDREEAEAYLQAAQARPAPAPPAIPFRRPVAEPAEPHPDAILWLVRDSSGVGIGSGHGRTAEEAMEALRRLQPNADIASALPFSEAMRQLAEDAQEGDTIPAVSPSPGQKGLPGIAEDVPVRETAPRLPTNLPPNVLIKNPAGTWSFVGAADPRLSLKDAKSGAEPTEKQANDARRFGPHAAGLSSRVFQTPAEAVEAAKALGYDVPMPAGEESPAPAAPAKPKKVRLDSLAPGTMFDPGPDSGFTKGRVERVGQSGASVKLWKTPKEVTVKGRTFSAGSTELKVWSPSTPVLPLDAAPEEAQGGVKRGKAHVEPRIPAEPADEPQAEDRRPLEGVPPADVAGPEEQRSPDGGAVAGDRADEVRVPRRRRQRAPRGPGVGTGPGGVGVPAGEPEPDPAVVSAKEVAEVVEVEQQAGEPEAAAETLRVATRKSRGHDYRIDAEKLGTGSPKTKVRANLDAIKLLKQIESEGRQATKDEQDILVQYVGWGAFPQLFKYQDKEYYDPQWRDLRSEMEDLVDPKELAELRRSTTNAHYTSVPVVKAMWDAVSRMGIGRHARVLEPSMGVGHFFGLQPSSSLPAARTGVELDSVTGGIAKLLYPNASILVKGLQETDLPSNHYDLAISNVPFANVRVNDPTFRKHPEVLKSLHDYFFAKALDLVKPGGLAALITSRYTMDKKDPSVRKYLAQRANLVGAIRLPNTAFKQNAGTEVVTDIVFLRKLLPGEQPSGETWAETSTMDLEAKAGQKFQAEVNEYFLRNPQMVLGAHSGAGSMYSGAEYTVTGTTGPEDLARAVSLLPEDVVRSAATTEEPERAPLKVAQAGVKAGAYTISDGKLMVRQGEGLVPSGLTGTTEQRVRGMVGVRDAARKVLDTQLDDAAKDSDLKKAQGELGKLYDAFVKKHGFLHAQANRRAFDEDPEAALVLALESWDPDAKTAEKTAIFTKRTIEQRKRIEKADDAVSALTVSLNEAGRIDWPRMEKLTGKNRTALQEELSDRVFQNPEGLTWETADEYLSGNVRKKLKQAQTAARSDEAFERNVTALKAVQPEDLKPADIHVRLGSPWIPKEDVGDYVRSILDMEGYAGRGVEVAHSRELGLWALSVPSFAHNSVKATETWGTKRKPAPEIIDDLLNLRQPTVWDRLQDDRRVVNQDETIAAREKADALNDELTRWLWDDAERAQRLVRIYNDMMNNLRGRLFDGAHLTFPGMNRTGLTGQDLLKHQKNAAWRIILANPRTNVLLNHAVGAGKTYALIAGIMERIRIGVTTKAGVAVPNHLVAQWGAAVIDLYPQAKVLVVQKKHVTPEGRKNLMARIATGQYDIVVMSYEAFGKLPVKASTYERFTNEQIAELETAILGMTEQKMDTRIVKKLEASKTRLQEKIKAYLDKRGKDDAVSFEDLGLDFLGVDEAHGFKRLDTPSKQQVMGIARGGSMRAMDLYMKARTLNQSGGVLGFATGTPITNTMGEAYILQKYLQPELLKERGIEHFDSWAANFGQARTTVEYDATGRWKQKTRFVKFINVSDLSTMLAESMDTMLAEDLGLPVPKHKVVVHALPPSSELLSYIKDLAERADNVKKVDPTVDNMLKITTDGRKAGTDMRLVDPSLGDDPGSKINVATEEVFRIWKETAPRKATQLVFIDLSTPKARKEVDEDKDEPKDDEDTDLAEERAANVSLYHEMKTKLIKLGVPKAEIAFIHDVKTDAEKAKLSAAVNAGRVRILLGSGAKMGTGLNVQRKLFAIHEITPPYRPDEVEQGEGRMIRQGNEHYGLDITTEVHRYVQERSYDAVMWQGLENKAGFIRDFLRAESGVRVVEDTDTVQPTEAQMKAIATGDPRVVEKVGIDAEVDRYTRLERTHRNAQFGLKFERQNLQRSIDGYRTRIEEFQGDIAQRDKAPDGFALNVGKGTFTDREEAGTEILEAVVKLEGTQGGKIGEYKGFDLEVSFRTAMDGSGKKEVQKPELWVGRYQASLSTSPDGTVRSVEYQIKNIEPQLSAEKAGLARAEKNLKDLGGEEGKPFPHAKKLEDLRARQKELDAALNPKEVDRGVDPGEGGGGDEGGGPPKGKARPGAPEQDPGESKMGAAARKARERLKSGKGTTANDLGSAAAQGAGTLRDLGIIGADLIARGFQTFKRWARAMTKLVGSFVKGLAQALGSLFRRSQQPQAPAGPTQRTAAGGFTLAEETKLGTWARFFQDRFRRAKTVTEDVKRQGGRVREESDFYAKEELFHGRTEERLRDIDARFVDVLERDMGRNRVSLEDLDRYLYAKHAPRRNQIIADRTNGKVTDGSGMSDAEAAQILREFQPRQQVMEQLAERVREMNREQVRTLVDGDLMTQEQANAWRKEFGDDYVPLRSFEAADGPGGAMGTGTGFNIRGKESQHALGRASKADSPASFAVEQLKRAVVRAEKNKVGKAFAEFVRENPDPALWEIDKKHTRRELNTAGQVVEVVDHLAYADDFHFKEGGEARRITISDPLLLRAMKNLSAAETGKVLQKIGNLTRFYSTMVTTANPEFIATNFLRDIQAAVANVSADQGAKIAAGMPGAVRKAIPAMWRTLRDPNAKGKWADYAREIREEGGTTGFYSLKDAQDIAAQLGRGSKLQGPGVIPIVLRKGKAIFQAVSDANKAVENGVRLALYGLMRDAGFTKTQSARAAKNVTLNFNRKGEAGPAMNSLYAFFNANVQGLKRMGDLLKSDTGKKIAAGVIGIGLAQEILNRALSGDDNDDGTIDYDEIPEYVKEKNLVLTKPGGGAFTFPMPYGFNVLHTMGRQIGAVGFGATKPARAAVNVVSALVNAFNPLGGKLETKEDVLQVLAPTAIDPVVEDVSNRNFAGRQIRPEHFPGAPRKPGSEMAFTGVNPLAQGLARALNSASGGDRHTPGYVSVSPETIEHYWGWLTGGMGRFASNTGRVLGAGLSGELPAVQDIPVIRRLAYQPSEFAEGQQYRANLQEATDLWGRYHAYRKEGDFASIRSIPVSMQRAMLEVREVEKHLERLRRLERMGVKTPELERQKNALYVRANRVMTQARAQA